MNASFRSLGRRLCAVGLVVSAPSVWAVDLVGRDTNVFGNFALGTGSVVDSGSFLEVLTALDLAYSRSAADVGSVNGVFRGDPVQGTVTFASRTEYAVADHLIVGSGATVTTGATPYDHVAVAVNASSLLRLRIRVAEQTPFVLTGSVGGELGPDVGMWTSKAAASFRFTGCAPCLWTFASPGDFLASGTLMPGIDYTLEGNASSSVNGEGFYRFALQLAPIPEPGTWAMLALGLAGVLVAARRR
jgi:hypothetical protein